MIYQEIIDICKRYKIENYSINSNGSIDVDGDVNLTNFILNRLPLSFNRVNGNFLCGFNVITTLEGSPTFVSGTFDCSINYLNNLEFAPKYVGYHFICSYNFLTSLYGSPSLINGDFYCNNNCLTTLEQSPKIIKYGFFAYCNNLLTLKGNIETVGDNFDCSNNKLTSLEFIPNHIGKSISCTNNDILIDSIVDSKEICQTIHSDYNDIQINTIIRKNTLSNIIY